MTSIKDDDLTPKRCFSGNVLTDKTHKIYVIGGSDCNDDNKYYNTQLVRLTLHSTVILRVGQSKVLKYPYFSRVL